MQIQKTYAISLFLDTRRKKANGLFPLKLRVFDSSTRKTKLYSTKFEFETEKHFNSVWKTEKPRKIYEDLRLELLAVENQANNAAKTLTVFTFEGFEQAMKFLTKGRKNVFSYYQQAIELYRQNGQIGTATNYEQSLKSLKRFCQKESLLFTEITPQWLRNYEQFMTTKGKTVQPGSKPKGLSITTIGIYLRPLRAIFNTAIQDKLITADLYPFGHRKYTIPAPKATKKALTKDQLKTLFETTPQTPDQEKAKAFWFFSYSCNGLNVADIARLQYKNISNDLLSFRRFKTKNTKREQAPIHVFLTDFAKQVIEQYGIKPASPESLIFEIIDNNATPEKQHRQVLNFVKYMNQHFKKFADNLNIPNVSTYTARHTFATNSIRQGATMEFVSEALGHSSLKTTKGYFAGFESETRKQFAEKLMQF
jgi:site-specific recombinase XerD